MNFNKRIIGIMAATDQGVIGYNNTLPWSFADEFEHFRKVTMNHIMIMGRKTYETTPKTLMHDQQSIVLSHDSSLFLEDAKVITSLDKCLRYIDELNTQCNIFMIGGAQIAHLFLANNLISSFVFTQIHKPYLGDTYLNLGYFKLWSKSILKDCNDYTIYQLTNPKETL